MEGAGGMAVSVVAAAWSTAFLSASSRLRGHRLMPSRLHARFRAAHAHGDQAQVEIVVMNVPTSSMSLLA